MRSHQLILAVKVSLMLLLTPLPMGHCDDDVEDRWVKDARAEWPASTSVLRAIGGDSVMVLQIGGLRSDWNSGSLILLWDVHSWSYKSLRILRLTKPWGEYEVFMMNPIPEKEQEHLMKSLHEMVDVFQREIAITEESKVPVGGVERSSGCLVVELTDKAAFRQYASNNLKNVNVEKLHGVVEIFDWWFNSNVNNISMKSDETLRWKGEAAPRLPIEFLKIKGK